MFKLVKRTIGAFGYKTYDKDGYSGFEKMRNSDMVSQERLLDVNMTGFCFCFLDKTLLMVPSVQINSFLNDFRLCFIYQNIVLIIV